MSLSTEDLAIKWRTLPADGSTTAVLPVKTLAGEVRLGVSVHRELQVFLPVDVSIKIPKASTTVIVEDREFESEGSRLRFLVVTCKERSLDEVFISVCHLVLAKLEDGHTTEKALAEAFAEFRRLLSRRAGRFGSGEILGLIGELYILRGLLQSNPGAAAAWTGPEDGRHDFRFGESAIEVKASIRQQQPVIEISSLTQLEMPSENGTLHLVHLVVEDDPDGALNPSGLYEDCRNLANEPDLIVNKIAAFGMAEEEIAGMVDESFSLFSLHAYRVCEGFPRLTPNMVADGTLPVGVSHLAYRIDLGSAHQYMLSDPECDQLLATFGDAGQ